MTDRAQFEAMLEALINEDQESAKEIFHNIVVSKSREIYEELLESEFDDSKDRGPAYGSEEQEEESMEEEGMEEEGMEEEGADDEESDDEESDDEEGDDADSEEEPDFGDEEGAEDGDMEDRVMDLEDALEDLKAEFEQLLAGEEAEETDHPGIHDMGGDDMGDMGGDDMGDMDENGMPIMEYVNKVPNPTHGDNGVQNTSMLGGKSSPRNNMGGTTANIVNGQREVSADIGAKSTVKGNGVMGTNVVPNPDAKGNVNVPGGKAGKTGFKTQVKGGGIDRQAGFNKPGQNAGAETGKNSRDGEKNTQSTLRARK
jgi:hypothetical protein